MNISYDALVFDIDGTLWTAMETSKKAFNKALKDHGYKEQVSLSDVISVTGLPFDLYLKNLFPFVENSFYDVLDEYERVFIKKEGGHLYEGVISGLKELSSKVDLYLVSNCDTWYLDAFLDFSSLSSIIKSSHCHGHERKSKAVILSDLIIKNNLNKTVYIGDRLGDFEAANEAGMDFIHAAYDSNDVVSNVPVASSFNEVINYLMNK